MWQTMEERLTLLELLSRGTLRRRRSQENTFSHLHELSWTRATGRRDEIALVDGRRRELVLLLDRVWPAWKEGLAELTARGLPPTPEGWARLLDARRAEGLGDLPERLNRRTAAALAAPHSKATLSEGRLAALGDVETTHDGTIRLRPPAGLVAITDRGSIDLSAIAHVLGEVAIPERAFLDGLRIEGAIQGVLLVENLGAWRDLPQLPGWLFAHVPGWDTVTVSCFLDHVAHVPVVHFGDLDPNGARIYQHLRAHRPNLVWFVPDFWREFLDRPGHPSLSTTWPPDLDLAGAPLLVGDLATRGRWLEQEPIVLDPRLGKALDEALRTSLGGEKLEAVEHQGRARGGEPG